jgi:hypothetical protein
MRKTVAQLTALSEEEFEFLITTRHIIIIDSDDVPIAHILPYATYQALTRHAPTEPHIPLSTITRSLAHIRERYRYQEGTFHPHPGLDAVIDVIHTLAEDIAGACDPDGSVDEHYEFTREFVRRSNGIHLS